VIEALRALPLAHGGTAGVVVETASVMLVGAVIVAAWVRSRRHPEDDASEDPDRRP
jgi:hypothetical protein